MEEESKRKLGYGEYWWWYVVQACLLNGLLQSTEHSLKFIICCCPGNQPGTTVAHLSLQCSDAESDEEEGRRTACSIAARCYAALEKAVSQSNGG